MPSLPLRARFLAYRAKTAAFRHSAPGWRRACNGAEMWLDPSDGTDNAFVAGNFAHELRWHLKRFLRPGCVVADGGAQKGLITLLMSRLVGRDGQVMSFEPDPRARALLEKNLRQNGTSNVRVFDCALSDTVGDTEFLLSSKLGWSALRHHAAIDRTLVEKISVRVAPFDEIASDLHRLDFVKLDCQGAEPAILRGMVDTLTRLGPDLWFEVDHDGLVGAGGREAELTSFLVERDYALFLPQLVRRFEIPVGVRYEALDALPVQLTGDYDALAVKRGSETHRRLSRQELSFPGPDPRQN